MAGFAEDPQSVYGLKLDKQSFYRWVARQPHGRFELKDGSVVQQMTGASKPHNRIAANFILTLGTRLDRNIWSVTSNDLAVEIGEDVRYPDLVVERLDAQGPLHAALQPLILVEILSPSSVGTDMNIKLAEYTTIPSLEAYIVASQDEPIIWVWQRAPATGAFPHKPEEFKGRDAALSLRALNISLPLAELYHSIA